MMHTRELASYFIYIDNYLNDRKKNLLNKIIYNKGKLKKIISRDISKTRITKSMLIDFITLYSGSNLNLSENIFCTVDDYLYSLNISANNTSIRLAISTKPTNNTIYITVKNKEERLPISINVENDISYKGNIERNKIIINHVQSMIQDMMALYLHMEIDLNIEYDRKRRIKNGNN